MVSYKTTNGYELITKESLRTMESKVHKGRVVHFGIRRKVCLISCSSEKELVELSQMLLDAEFQCYPTMLDSLKLKVNGEKTFWAIIERKGITLTKWSKNHKDAFFEEGLPLPSEFYQKILKDLLLITRRLMDTNYNGPKTTDDIFVCAPTEYGVPRVLFMNFEKRDVNLNDWKGLAQVIADANNNLGYYSKCAQPEMLEMIKALRSQTTENRNLDSIMDYPLFWTPDRRRYFVVSIGGKTIAEKTTDYYSNEIAKRIFGEDVKNWYKCNPIMPKLIAPSYHEPKDSLNYVGLKWHFNNALVTIRNVYGHYATNLSGDMSIKDLQAHMENSFPRLVWELYLRDRSLHV